MRWLVCVLSGVWLTTMGPALCCAADEAPLTLRPGMEWRGTILRETIRKNAAFKYDKTRGEHVDPFHLRISEVNGSTITGEFGWHTLDENKAVRFKGTLKPNGQFSFPVTDVIKGQLGPGIIGSAVLGAFGPNAETVKGTVAFMSRKVTAFEGTLTEEKHKGGKKGGKSKKG